jgi:RNA polymerase sigma-70 factor, ECF subfamily
MSTAAYADYEALVEPHRRELQAHCYRMLGSVQDAEDALQDALLRAWKALDRFEGRSSARSWLYRIATNSCLDAIARRPKRGLPIDYDDAPAGETIWLEPCPDALVEGYEQRESIELAFIAALQHLPARQRAVLILRDVLGFSGAEVAQALDTTPASVYSALQRAHDSVDRRLPELSQQATLRAFGDDGLREIVARYVDAWERHDVDALAAMLTEGVTLAMPPTATWYRGRDAVTVGLARGALAAGKRWRLSPSSASGQAAAAASRWDEATGSFVPHHTAVLTLRGTQIDAIDAFHAPSWPASQAMRA